MEKVIAIDGPCGVGKSSVAKRVAQELAWTYLDTGSMYRGIALAWLRAGQREELLEDERWLTLQKLSYDAGCVTLDGVDVSAEIRTPEISQLASRVSARPGVRRFLTRLQQEFGAVHPCVLEGRDIGTIVFPNAFLKVFLAASLTERAKRRWLQLGGRDAPTPLDAVKKEIQTRDHRDSKRALAPLKAAADAWHLDTGALTEDAVVQAIAQEARRRLAVRERSEEFRSAQPQRSQ